VRHEPSLRRLSPAGAPSSEWAGALHAAPPPGPSWAALGLPEGKSAVQSHRRTVAWVTNGIRCPMSALPAGFGGPRAWRQSSCSGSRRQRRRRRYAAPPPSSQGTAELHDATASTGLAVLGTLGGTQRRPRPRPLQEPQDATTRNRRTARAVRTCRAAPRGGPRRLQQPTALEESRRCCSTLSGLPMLLIAAYAASAAHAAKWRRGCQCGPCCQMAPRLPVRLNDAKAARC
jgi:hypothetical protein